jgi:Glycosyl transferase 4-like domain
MREMKRVIIVSPNFPPSTLAGVHRARILAKHLPAVGWRPTVLCVHESFYEETTDPELAALLPADLDIVKTKALPYQLTRLAGIGDISLRAFHHLKTSLREILDKRAADAVFITGSPYYPMLFSRWLKQRYGKPVILDFQDPWVSTYGAAQSRVSKIGLAHLLATRLEPRALRHADFITAVSDTQNAEMARRYPWLDAGNMAAIPIGGDADDFTYLTARDRLCPWIPSAPGCFNVGYIGNVWPGAHRTLEVLFAAVARLKMERPQLYQRLRLVFVGSSNQPGAAMAEVVMPFARRAGIAENVSEAPERIPYLDALNVMLRSDVLLMLGSNEPHYTASKLYPTLLAKRPVLAIFHELSSVCAIAEAVGGVMLVKFGDAIPVETKAGEITQALAVLTEGVARIHRVDSSKLEPYLGPAIAGRFADIFDRVQNAAKTTRV